MTYLMVSWIHDFEDEPILIFSEVDEMRNELRKIEFYRDESFGIASRSIAFGGSELGLDKIPDPDEIRSDPQFLVREITSEEFEENWRACLNFLSV